LRATITIDKDTVNSEEEALSFINKYGFVTLFPIRRIIFPNLYQATVGNREEKFDNAWKWADDLAMKKLIHYGKLVRKQVTLVSLEFFPYLYRLCREKTLSTTVQKILDFIKAHGSASTTVLRKSLDLTGKEKKYVFTKAMDELQMAFTLAIVGREKPPRMTHIYDLIERWMPQSPFEKANAISEKDAKDRVIAKLLENKLTSTWKEAQIFLGDLQNQNYLRGVQE
jgi:hypothetical protein